MTEDPQYADFLDVLTDTISGTDMMSKEWHQEMYRFWKATTVQSSGWQPIETAPVGTEALLLGSHGFAVGYKSLYDWEPSGVSASYDMARSIFEIGALLYWSPLPNHLEVIRALAA